MELIAAPAVLSTASVHIALPATQLLNTFILHVLPLQTLSAEFAPRVTKTSGSIAPVMELMTEHACRAYPVLTAKVGHLLHVSMIHHRARLVQRVTPLETTLPQLALPLATQSANLAEDYACWMLSSKKYHATESLIDYALRVLLVSTVQPIKRVVVYATKTPTPCATNALCVHLVSMKRHLVPRH
jgi:hypothetical protein